VTIETERLISPLGNTEDRVLDKTIRPQCLSDYIGQTRVREQMEIFISAARSRGEALDHILIFGPPGLGKCITADSYILTKSGWTTLASLLPPQLTAHTAVPKRLPVYNLAGLQETSHIYSSGIQPTLRLTTAAGFTIQGTFHHPIWVATPQGPQWKTLSEIKRNDWVAIARDMQLWQTPPRSGSYQLIPVYFHCLGPAGLVQKVAFLNWQITLPTTYSSDLAYLVGVIIGNAYFDHLGNCYIRTCHPQIIAKIKQLWGHPPQQVQQTLCLPAHLMHKKGLSAKLLENLPAPILQGPATTVAACLRGLFDVRGQVRPTSEIELTLPANQITTQIQLLLSNFGIIARRHLKQIRHQLYHKLFISGQDFALFQKHIGFHLKKLPTHLKVRETKENLPFTQLIPLATPSSHPKIYWDRVVANLPTGPAAVYDFCVPHTHSFVANGFYNHNTTLAQVTANEMKAHLRQTSGPILEKAGDLAALLTHLEPHDILFIDEIHRLNPVVEEILYPAMEDFQLDILIGEGPAARSIKLELPPFTLIGATTRAGLLTSPLRDRFGITHRLEFYSHEELTHILTRSANLLQVPLAPQGALELARRSRGTPRIANRLLRRVRDYAQVRADGHITLEVAQQALDLLNVDTYGLDIMDRKLLKVMIEKFKGGPVGIETLAAAINEERGTIEEIIEPFLLQQGFLMRTRRGRLVTRSAWQHLGLLPPPDLFHE